MGRLRSRHQEHPRGRARDHRQAAAEREPWCLLSSDTPFISLGSHGVAHGPLGKMASGVRRRYMRLCGGGPACFAGSRLRTTRLSSPWPSAQSSMPFAGASLDERSVFIERRQCTVNICPIVRRAPQPQWSSATPHLLVPSWLVPWSGACSGQPGPPAYSAQSSWASLLGPAGSPSAAACWRHARTLGTEQAGHPHRNGARARCSFVGAPAWPKPDVASTVCRGARRGCRRRSAAPTTRWTLRTDCAGGSPAIITSSSPPSAPHHTTLENRQ